jgi:GT2 family glycosyltransferase
MKIKASVIICTRNRPRLLRRALEALAEQTVDKDRFEIVVVDDCSSEDETARVCDELRRRFSALTYERTDEHLGLAAGRRIGMRAAEGDQLLFTDDDCVPNRDWVSAMTRLLDEHPFVAGAVETPVDDLICLCHNIAEFYGVMPCRRAGPVTFLAGANMGVRRSVVEKAGGFGDQLTPGEDVAFALRAREKGFTPWFSPEPRVVHRPDHASWSSIFSYAARHASSTIRWRNEKREVLRTPLVLRSAFLIALASPFLALAVTVRIYAWCPPLLRFWWTVPVVFALKLAWCAGAATGLRRL